MTTTEPHHWRIAAGFGLHAPTHRSGTANSLNDAWTHALAIGRAVLLAGAIEDLTVVIDDNRGPAP